MLSNEEVGLLAVYQGLHHVEIPLLAEFIRHIESAVLAKQGKLAEQAKAEPAEAVQWRNIKHVVHTLADWAFGSKNDPKYGACWLAMVNGLTCKDGPEFKLEPLHPAPTPEGMAMVPRKMTVAVGCAWKDATDAGATLQEMWDAMIAAAEKEHG